MHTCMHEHEHTHTHTRMHFPAGLAPHRAPKHVGISLSTLILIYSSLEHHGMGAPDAALQPPHSCSLTEKVHSSLSQWQWKHPEAQGTLQSRFIN